MNGGSKIVDLRVSDVPYDAAADVEGYAMQVETDDDPVPTGPWPRIFGVLAIVASLGWVGFIGWYLLTALLPYPQPLALAQVVTAVMALPALIGIVWLIARRTSRAEARRFAGTARSMREEAAHLQEVIDAMTHTIEANRVALADQVTSMMAAASGMADQISTAETQAARLDAAARVAAEKLSVLMATLPRVHADTEALAGKIENTGLTASERASALDAAIVALAERGREADALTSGAAERLAAHIARMESTSESAGARLESVTSSMSDAVDGLLGRTASAVEEAHKGIAAQGDAMLAMLATNQAAIDRTATDSTAALADRIAAIEAVVNHISATLGTSQEQIDGLTRSIDDSSGAAHRFAGEAAPQLLESLLRIRDTANAAADHARDAMERLIPVAGKAIETAGSHAVEASLAAIAAATETAATSASEASERLNRQMLEIAEASAQIEARIGEAQESDGFARRVSLLIETLNSQAIDISGIYATEVPDSAWANYLRGDRGAFARRAVRLLDTGEVRAIANAYQDDATVHEQVNRYIHDFEAMLRNVLAHRDSAPLGVTLLSSDMGKLYVALAQAIERLRA
jgi:hypothetical protein